MDCPDSSIEVHKSAGVNDIISKFCDSKSVKFSERISGFVNSATKRRLGKLDGYTIAEYLKRVPTVSVLTSLIFIEKLTASEEAIKFLQDVTSADLFVVAMMVASKYLHDVDTVDGVWNTEWAEQFNIDLKELNELEVKFMWAINWKFHIGTQDFIRLISSSGIFADKASRLTSGSSVKAVHRYGSRLGIRKRRRSTKLLTLLTTTYLACIASQHIPMATEQPPHLSIHPAAAGRNTSFGLVNTSFTTSPMQAVYSQSSSCRYYSDGGGQLTHPMQSPTWANSDCPPTIRCGVG